MNGQLQAENADDVVVPPGVDEDNGHQLGRLVVPRVLRRGEQVGVEQIHVKLSEAERLERGEALALAQEEKADLEAQKKSFMDAHKDKLGKIELRIHACTYAIRRGTESREVQIATLRDDARGEVVTYRTDTAEELKRRPMSWDERQLELMPQPVRPKAASYAVVPPLPYEPDETVVPMVTNWDEATRAAEAHEEVAKRGTRRRRAVAAEPAPEPFYDAAADALLGDIEPVDASPNRLSPEARVHVDRAKASIAASLAAEAAVDEAPPQDDPPSGGKIKASRSSSRSRRAAA